MAHRPAASAGAEHAPVPAEWLEAAGLADAAVSAAAATWVAADMAAVDTAKALSHKFVEEKGKTTAGPSTPFCTKNVPNFAQDDSAFCLANQGLMTHKMQRGFMG